MSSVNTCLSTAGVNHRPCAPVPVDGLGGIVVMDARADFPYARKDGTFECVECFAVEPVHLPSGVCAILGLPAVLQLDISADASIRHRARVIHAPPIR